MTRFGERRALLRIFLVWGITAVGLHTLALVIPGVHVSGWRAAIIGAATIGLLNALVWPLFVRIALPITVLTLGFGALLCNGVFVYLGSLLVEGFKVDSIWSGVAVAVGLTLINTVATTILAIDDDDFYYRQVIQRQAERGAPQTIDIPGVVFVQIDGLAYDVLQHALRTGDVSTIEGWLRDGSHRLLRWETDWSSQTGASQAGLLHGSNDDIPAFRWFEKELGVARVCNHPTDAMEIERRRSNGRGLLAFDGASRANVFSGDAPRSSLTMSTVLRRDRGGRIGQDYYAYFANPYNVARTMILAIREIVLEIWSASEQRRRNVQPRVSRRFPYPLVRAWTCVIQRDLQSETVMADIYAGRPVIYTDLLAYDEVAHHSGIERQETLRVLRNLDRHLARMGAAARDAKRRYALVVISDHGQTQGPTFRQRWGETLEDLVRKACAGGGVQGSVQGDESWGYLAGSLTEAAAGSGVAARVLRTATRSKTTNGIVELGPNAARRNRGRSPAPTDEPSEIVVMGSGCLGLIYFPRRPGRLTLEEIEGAYPDLIPTLRAHPGVGFLLIRSERRGAVVLGRSGANYLDEGVVEGEDPLAPFGSGAARHVKRSDGFQHVADIMVNSAYDPESDEVYAFEELVGSHGGMGGPQTFPFILLPSDWAVPEQTIVGAEAMHQWMRRWLQDLGQSSGTNEPSFTPPARA
jgi:uncharacterized membrane protein YvlD (DUF360 family)